MPAFTDNTWDGYLKYKQVIFAQIFLRFCHLHGGMYSNNEHHEKGNAYSILTCKGPDGNKQICRQPAWLHRMHKNNRSIRFVVANLIPLWKRIMMLWDKYRCIVTRDPEDPIRRSRKQGGRDTIFGGKVTWMARWAT